MSEKICTIYNVTSEFADEAIDLSRSNIAGYMTTFNPSNLVFKKDMKPYKFFVRRLTPEEVTLVSERSKTNGSFAAHVLTISLGLISIEKPDGTMFEPETHLIKIGSLDIKLHKNQHDVVEYLADTFGYDIFSELGSAIKKISILPINLTPFSKSS
jgi:hypothetical protein